MFLLLFLFWRPFQHKNKSCELNTLHALFFCIAFFPVLKRESLLIQLFFNNNFMNITWSEINRDIFCIKIIKKNKIFFHYLSFWSSFFKIEYPSGFDGSLIYMIDTGFPKKDARFSKIKNIPDLLSDDKEGRIIEISTFNIWAIGRLFWETLYLRLIRG